VTERVLGPTGSKRRLLRFLPMLAAVAAAVVLIPGGLAVHQEGIFELDKTPTVDANATNDPAVDGDDWDQVFAGTDNAEVSTFITDPSDTDTDTHFTGGGTKDHNDLTDWQHTQKKPSPPKDDITDAYAAAYVDPDDDHVIVYFGMDRFANNGDAQIGFWFFQDEVSLNADGTFTGIHTEGDVLVLSDFTQGGDISTIKVLQWVDIPGVCSGPTPDPNCEDANLLRIGQGVDCDATAVGDDVCASVNRGVVDAPWPYSAKFPPPPPNANDFPAGSFYEGGIDVSQLIPDVSCFTSFLAESRSSQSVDAVLKDFALGSFPLCRAEMNTVPVPDNEIDIGDSIQDQATVEGFGLNAPPPTGTVDFFVCGPLDPGELCETGGTLVSTETLDGTSNPSVVTSDAFTPNEAGRWCFRGVYSGDDNYGGVTDFDESECFTVNPAQPEIVTDATEGPVLIGDPIDDTATLSGTANDPDGNPAGGTITFTAYGPHSDTTTCDTVAYTSVVDVTGDGDYTASSGTGGQFIPTEVGTYNWIAVYSGDPPNTLGASTACGDANESSVVIQLQPTIATAQSVFPNDEATITVASGGGDLSGSVTFSLFDNATCTGTALFEETVDIPAMAGLTETVHTTNGDGVPATGLASDESVSVSGTYSWTSTFMSTNPGHENVTSPCHDEHFDVTFTNDDPGIP
jgi:hypothetical protein